jgi:hypothetical protein
MPRRNFLRLAGLVGGVALIPAIGRAGGDKTYDSMVLTCIDPRFVDPIHGFLAGKDLSGDYSLFAFAGAAVGVEAPAFSAWHQTFWDNLATSFQLHQITRVIAINHRDCGAAKIAFGAASVADPATETQTHARVLGDFRDDVAQRHPEMKVEGYLMAIDGTVRQLV